MKMCFNFVIVSTRLNDTYVLLFGSIGGGGGAVNYLCKAYYSRRENSWMLHTLYANSSRYEVSVCHMHIDLDFI